MQVTFPFFILIFPTVEWVVVIFKTFKGSTGKCGTGQLLLFALKVPLPLYIHLKQMCCLGRGGGRQEPVLLLVILLRVHGKILKCLVEIKKEV